MKSLIAIALMITSFTTFSAETSAVDSLLSVLPLGNYQGFSEYNKTCSVAVNEVSFPEKVITVVITNAQGRIFKVVNDDHEFLFTLEKLEFIQRDRQYVDSSRSSYIERIIRTGNAGENHLYVMVANEITVNRERTVEGMACLINLK